MTFDELLCRHIGGSMLKQNQLSAFLGNHNWNVDLYKGTVNFDRGRVFPIQIIGTESEIDHTWMWGWANSGSDIPAPLLEHAEQLREYGVKERVKELSSGQFPLQQMDGYPIAMVASGICNASAFYRGPYDGGALFFNITGIPLPRPTTIDIVSTLSKVIMQFPVDHRAMAQHFLEQQGFTVTEDETHLIGTSPIGDVNLTLDHANRLIDMQTTAKTPPADPNAKKPWWKFR